MKVYYKYHIINRLHNPFATHPSEEFNGKGLREAQRGALDILKETLLMRTDFTQLSDSPPEAAIWAEWRQQIRDLPFNPIDEVWFEIPDPPEDSLGEVVRTKYFDPTLLGIITIPASEEQYEHLSALAKAVDEANGITH